MGRILILLMVLVQYVLSISYEDIKSAYHRSFNYEKVQDYDNAIKSLMPVYKSYPFGYTVNLRLGWLYYLKGNFSNAVYHYETSLKALPGSIEPLLGLSLVYLAQKRYSDAERVCYQIIKTDPFNYYGNLRLAYALVGNRKLKQAEKVLMKMLTLYPSDPLLLSKLGEVRYLLGDLRSAGDILSDVLILDPENQTAREILSRIKSKSPTGGKEDGKKR